MNGLMTMLRLYRRQVLLAGALMLVPWVWAVYLIPWWAAAVCFALIVPVSAAVAYLVLPPPQAPRRATDDPKVSNEQIGRMREAFTGLNSVLGRWTEASQNAHIDLQNLQKQMAQVIVDTESYVINISNNFRAITAKNATQMECAMSLLESGENVEPAQTPDAVSAWLSLPDYIRAYESLLNDVTDRLMRFSAASMEMLKHRGKLRDNTVMVDELLDEIRFMAQRIGTLSLNFSVASGSSAGDQRNFVEMTDQIRSISENASDVNRRIRQYMEGLKEEMKATYNAMDKMAEEAREAAKQAKVEVAQLTVTMMMKTTEVGDMLSRINSLSREIRQDINNIIVAMQFQDIIQQKMQQLQHPLLTDISKSIQGIYDESRLMQKKLATMGGEDKPAAGPAAPFRVVTRDGVKIAAPEKAKPAEASEAAKIKLQEKMASTPDPAAAGDGNKVELF